MPLNIKRERELKGMTQEELAKKSGISRATISTLENDPDAVTTTSTLKKLAEALNVKVGVFLSD